VFTEIERICDFKIRFCVIDKTLDELWKLAKGSSKKALDAKLGIIMLQKKGLKKLPSKEGEYVDDAIIRHSSSAEAVATQDKELKQKLKGKTRIIVLRSKKKLEWA